MRKSMLVAAAAAAAALSVGPAQAAIDNYIALLYGANQVPTAGDPDGYGLASVSIDNVADTISWAIMAKDIALPLTGAHIHQGAAGVNGPVKVDFSAQTIGENLFDADLALITPATASGWYVNLHNADYPAGAIRGQLRYVDTASPVPEPASYGLMLAGLGMLGALALRRKH